MTMNALLLLITPRGVEAVSAGAWGKCQMCGSVD